MNEIEHYRNHRLPPAPLMPPAVNTGAARIREAAEVMVLCKQLADAVCNTNMMPKHLRGKPEETAAVMLYGATLDLDPMQAVRSIYEVHGQPGLYGRAMVGLVIGRGHEVWTVETSDDTVTVAGRRRGSGNVEQSTWTIDRAARAGYVPTVDPDTGKLRLNKWGKVEGNEKYLTDPQSMLYAKAASEVCRKVAPDVLAGVYAVEDLQSERDDERPTHPVTVASGTSNVDRLRATLTGEQEQIGNDAITATPTTDLTANTRGQLFALFAERGINDADEQRRGISTIIGHTIDSRAELTEAEAGAVIDRLRGSGKPSDDVVETADEA